MLGLRLAEGVVLEGLCTAFEKRLEEVEALARSWEAGGWAVYESGRLRLTERGMDIHSALCLQLL
jgi:coproporphyrinogen III oxidase-like Fe-S oxidoreductase